MALELTRSAKAYAEDGTPGGVPLADLENIVGTLVERYRHTETISTASTGTTAVRVNYKPLQHAAEYRIFLTDAGGTVLLNGTINALTWQGLIHDEAGDTLVHDGQNTQTGHRLAAVEGDLPVDPSIVLGRTEDNFILIQGIALPIGAILDVFSTEFSGGEITERLWRQTSAAPHVVRLKGYFADADAAEAAAVNVGYDGTFATGIASTNWQEQNDPYPDGATDSGSEFLYRANTVYNPLAGRWLLSTIDIVAVDGGVTVEYAVSDTGPWHATQADADKWRRWRDSAGYLHVEPLNELDDGWRFLASFRWDSGLDPDPGVYSAWEKALGFDIDFNEWKYVLATWMWGNSDRDSHILVPTEALRSQSTAESGFASGFGRVLHFRKNANGAPYDDAQQDAPTTDGDHSRGIQYMFLRSPTQSADYASRIRVDMGSNNSAVGTLRFFVGR